MNKPKKAPSRARVLKMPLANSSSTNRTAAVTTATPPTTDKAVRILAKSLFRQLKDAGYQNRDLLTLSTELVSLITTDLRPAQPEAPATPKSKS